MQCILVKTFFILFFFISNNMVRNLNILFGQRQSEIIFLFVHEKIKEITILETTRTLYFCMIFFFKRFHFLIYSSSFACVYMFACLVLYRPNQQFFRYVETESPLLGYSVLTSAKGSKCAKYMY